MSHICTVLVGSLALLLFTPSVRLTAEITTGVAEVNGTKLYYERQGQGHPLVLIHGGILSSTEWAEQLQPFAAHYQVLRYDVRGFGKSTVRELPYSNSEDLYQLLQFLKVEKTYLVGSSFGRSLVADYRGFLAPWYLAQPLKPPTLPRLSELSISTLIVLGQLDIPDVLTIGETLGEELPEAQTVTIPNAGHMVHMEKPQEFNRLVLDFLSQHKKR